MVVGRSEEKGLRGLAGRLFDMGLPATAAFSSPRASAFTLCGCHEYLNLDCRRHSPPGIL